MKQLQLQSHFKLIVVAFLLSQILGCNKVKITEEIIILKENESDPIINPYCIKVLNDDKLVFVNNEESISSYDVYSGRLINSIRPNFSIDELRESKSLYNDEIQFYDISKHPDSYMRNSQKLKVLDVIQTEKGFFVFCLLLNPIIYNNSPQLFYISILLNYDSNWKLVNYYLLETVSMKRYDFGLNPSTGIMISNNSRLLISAYNSKINYNENAMIATFNLSKDSLLFHSLIKYPFPDNIYFNKKTPKESSVPCQIYGRFDNFNKKIYYSDGGSIYDLSKKASIFKPDFKTFKDSIQKIYDFKIINYKNKLHVLLLVELLESPFSFGGTNKYLVLTDLKTSKIHFTKYIGKEVSGLAYSNSMIYIIRSEKDRIVLLKYKIS